MSSPNQAACSCESAWSPATRAARRSTRTLAGRRPDRCPPRCAERARRTAARAPSAGPDRGPWPAISRRSARPAAPRIRERGHGYGAVPRPTRPGRQLEPARPASPAGDRRPRRAPPGCPRRAMQSTARVPDTGRERPPEVVEALVLGIDEQFADRNVGEAAAREQRPQLLRRLVPTRRPSSIAAARSGAASSAASENKRSSGMRRESQTQPATVPPRLATRAISRMPASRSSISCTTSCARTASSSRRGTASARPPQRARQRPARAPGTPRQTARTDRRPQRWPAQRLRDADVSGPGPQPTSSAPGRGAHGHLDQPGGELGAVAPDVLVVGLRGAQNAHAVRLSSMARLKVSMAVRFAEANATPSRSHPATRISARTFGSA